MTYTTVVPTAILEGNIDTWAVLDCRFDLHQHDWGHQQYRLGHIPGAVYVSLSDDLAAQQSSGGRHPLPSVDALAATFGRLGIDRSTQVAVYDQDAGLFASRLWWSLRYLGHDAVAVVDGGWAKWVREGRPVRSGDESRRPALFVPQPRTGMPISLDEVIRNLDAPERLLIDARGPDRFEGQSEPIDRVAGHIPGAVNHFYRWNVDADGTFLSPAVLREKFAAVLDGRAPSQAIVYCGSGVSACHNLLAMEHAGLPGARLYVGSWSEWSSDPARPVETGPPRTRQRIP